MSRVKAHSVTPNWKQTEDLGPTKIRDTGRGEILLFKEFDWQTTRIEATAVEGSSSEAFLTTPLRFIANQSKIRITIKKRLSGNDTVYFLQNMILEKQEKKIKTLL